MSGANLDFPSSFHHYQACKTLEKYMKTMLVLVSFIYLEPFNGNQWENYKHFPESKF